MVNVEMSDIVLSKQAKEFKVAKDKPPNKVKKSRKERKLEKKKMKEQEEQMRSENKKRDGILKVRSDTAMFSKTYNLEILDKSEKLMRFGTANNALNTSDLADGNISA